MTMKLRGHRADLLLSTFAGNDLGGPATRSPISWRVLLRYGSGTAVVGGGVSLAELLELLKHREAIAIG
jgi:hypothetical protein